MLMGSAVPRKPPLEPKGKMKPAGSGKSGKGCSERPASDYRMPGDQRQMPNEGPQEVVYCHRFPPGQSLASFPRVVRLSRKPVD